LYLHIGVASKCQGISAATAERVGVNTVDWDALEDRVF
jgi:hypothetical protein